MKPPLRLVLSHRIEALFRFTFFNAVQQDTVVVRASRTVSQPITRKSRRTCAGIIFLKPVHFLREQKGSRTPTEDFIKSKESYKKLRKHIRSRGGQRETRSSGNKKKETKKIRRIIPIALAMIQYEENISSWHALKEGQRLA
jgi:hypothetical protein